MSYSFFINSVIPVTQNTTLYSNSLAANNSAYDYIILINLNGVAMNNMFNTRTYQQGLLNNGNIDTNGNNINFFVANLVLNTDLINDVLGSLNSTTIFSNNTGVTSATTAYASFQVTGSVLPLRFLEVAAVKIFGHAGARSAIQNDSDYYLSSGLLGTIVEGMNNRILNQNIRNTIFQQYTSMDRIENAGSNDINTSTTLNLFATTWDFPVNFTTSLNETNGPDSLGLLNNGPVVGGNQLINGTVSVPMLLRFTSTA